MGLAAIFKFGSNSQGTLKMEAEGPSEILLLIYHTSCCHIPRHHKIQCLKTKYWRKYLKLRRMMRWVRQGTRQK
jgi:hypothetical protein